jgi:hypothetical protein
MPPSMCFARPESYAMPRTFACTAMAALLAASLVTVGVDARDDSSVVIIRVYDTTDTASNLRSAAIRTAAEIVADAGIAVEWRDCTSASTEPACQDVRPGHDLIVRIMPEVTPSASFRGSALQLRTVPGGSFQLGVAVINPVTLSGEMATIFYEQVRSVARRSGVEDADLLGRALAHETGHLLLRVREHSRTGLMRGVWSIEELTQNRPDDWTFAPADRLRLQRLLASATP